MKRNLVAGFVFMGLVLVAGAAVAEPNFTEGQWEVKGEMKLEGMPFPMPAMPFGYSHCITKKDMVPQKAEKNQECTQGSQKIDGNTVTWSMTCKDKDGNVTETNGTVTYAGTSFDSTMHNVMTDAKKNKTTSTLTMKGKRTGECAK